MILNYCGGRYGQYQLSTDPYTIMGLPFFPWVLTTFSDFTTHLNYEGRVCWHLG